MSPINKVGICMYEPTALLRAWAITSCMKAKQMVSFNQRIRHSIINLEENNHSESAGSSSTVAYMHCFLEGHSWPQY
jgi:hypothetical protein